MPGYLVGQLLGIPSYREKTTTLVLSAQETLYKAILVLLTLTAIIWMSIFLYATFYYSYMPAISHARPVHLQFSRSCDKKMDEGMCTFPTANVTLTKRQQLLMVGQPYKIILEMEMPESPANQHLGMFLVCADLKDKEGVYIEKSCRSAMLHYKSYLHHALSTIFFSPFLLSGSSEEKQHVQVELYANFEEDPHRPVTNAFVQIQSQHVEIYRTHLKIHAHFTGLRYVMFHWPVVSAVIGITTNLFFLAVVAFLSWFKFFTPRQVSYPASYDANQAKTLEERRALAKQRLMKERGKLMNQRVVVPGTSQANPAPATNKEDLDTAPEKPEFVKPKVTTTAPASIPVTKISEERKRSSSNGSDSDSVIHKDETEKLEEPLKMGNRSSSEEFVVVPDVNDPLMHITRSTLSTPDNSSISQKADMEKESEDDGEEELHKDNDNNEEDKENKPKFDDGTDKVGSGSEADTESMLRHRGSQSKKPE